MVEKVDTAMRMVALVGLSALVKASLADSECCVMVCTQMGFASYDVAQELVQHWALVCQLVGVRPSNTRLRLGVHRSQTLIVKAQVVAVEVASA